jgi:puromycin-sensitive aminopeptidase
VPEQDPYRLPRAVIPSRYQLTLEPDLDAAAFAGDQQVVVEVIEPVDEVVLNADELEIDEAWFEPAGGGSRRTATVTLEPSTERARLSLDETLDAGSWVLHTTFRGVLNDKLTGFYRSTFTDESGEDHVIAVTQFEATHARKAFPCWDEPEMKAVFSVTLVVPAHLTAVSNGAELSNELVDGDRRRITFADTMKMSTYIVAFVVGPLEATKAVRAGDAPVRVVHVPGKGHLTGFALESAAFALQFFTDYYGIPYASDKCDLVAVPDFAFGAMENLGCITFREVLLLVDPSRSTQPELQNIADVIHHEVAHMWFGDLVTMKWWNGIWLNEAFATFMEVKCTDAFRPEWERWVSFGLSRSAAFEVDSLQSTRPIEFEVVSPQDAEGMFDILTYEKGAAVLRMLEQYLGVDTFRDGIRHYLSLHKYSNTETTDLWDAIEESSGEPVRQIMDTWIFQGGYPVVEAELVGDRTLRLRQERFRYPVDGEDGQGADDRGPDGTRGAQSWAVPILYRWSAGGREEQARVLLTEAEQDVELPDSAEWVHINMGGSGFYRTRYRGLLRDRLADHVGELTPLERYNIVDDAFASVLQGASTAAEFIDLARSFADDTDLAVWQRLAGALATLDRIVDDATRVRLQATVRAIAAPALHRLGWSPRKDETDRIRETRATLFELVGVIGADEDVRTRARALHASYVDDPSSVDPAMAAAAVSVIADSGDSEDFESFLERFRKTDNPQEEMRYLNSLAKFRDKDSFSRMLDLTISEVRTQNAPFLLARAMTNRSNGGNAWGFIRDNWSTLSDRFPSNTMVRMAEGIRALSDPAVAQDVLTFFSEHSLPQGERTLAQHLERLRVNVAFRERERPALAAALE